ncbi:MAG: acyltransferase [Cellvibrionales bacterium]|nr:acyltransferase [Cellvibrionales bacterium]
MKAIAISVRQILGCFNPIQNVKPAFIRSADRFPAIDGLRALSMLYILITHSMVIFFREVNPDTAGFIENTPWYLQWILMGDKAVDVFFMISGFLIGCLLFNEYKKQQHINLKRFYLRRWLRLTPLYWSFLLLFSVFAVTGIKANYVAAYAFYLNNFLAETNRYIPWLWSLAVEEQFYLLFPLLLSGFLVKRQDPLNWLYFLLVASLVIRFAILLANPEFLVSGKTLLVGKPGLNDAYNQALYINLHSRFGPIIMGIILAYWTTYHNAQLLHWLSGKKQLLLLGVAIGIFIGFLLLPVYKDIELPLWLYYLFHTAHRHVFAFIVGLIILLCLHPIGLSLWINRVFSSRLLYPFAQLSYAMYLLHLPLLFIVFGILHQQGWLQTLTVGNIFVLAAVTLVPLLLLSLFAFVLIEQPFMRLRQVNVKQNTQPPLVHANSSF